MMVYPLYQLKNFTVPEDSLPNGLLWDKFFDGWEDGFKEIQKDGKKAWIERLSDPVKKSREALKKKGKEIEECNKKIDNKKDKEQKNKLQEELNKHKGEREELSEKYEKCKKDNDNNVNKIRELLEEYKVRRDNLFKSLGATVVSGTTAYSFVTGMGLAHPVENGFLWHPTLGVPYLPGSSVKGMVRAWAQHYADAREAEEIDRLFGTGQRAGEIILFDAVPDKFVELMCEIMTPHDDGWRMNEDKMPSDWVSPVPIPYLAVAPGQSFVFAWASRRGKTENGEC
jgi:CRISPR type III-B/RAMP module RAMP protein Cmr6